ncbi:MAG: NUDIX domain-containing protein [Actinomycetales bacterium]|nr:NUDIX domain-containing protein [Actinomycetales bacterium]
MSDTVRSAATVVLLRDGESGLETYLLRRVSTMAFAPRMHVFPGGRVDDRDYEVVVEFTSGDAEALALRGSTDVPGIRALYACAVRETLEEAGIELVAVDPGGRLVIDPAELPLIDHWVTPEVEGHRYDVRFFAARVTSGQAILSTTEADEAVWMRPDDALTAFRDGFLPMLPPTEAVLRHLSGFASAADVVSHAPTRTIVPLMPRRELRPDGTHRWILVNERTGEVLIEDVRPPHTRETDGLPMEQP